METGVSVIICTYNGATLLPETLRHIALQQVRPEIPWEVIVIDNASTDQSSETAQACWQNSGNPTSFTVLMQPKPGLTYARELALEKAKYEYVLFCDDDNWLVPDFISRAFDLMQQHPQIGMLGGHGELVFQRQPPVWAAGSRLFASGPQAKASGKVNRNVVYGAGCVMRRTSYEQLLNAGFRSRLTDRKGASLSSGGDYELCFGLAMTGYEIWYDEQLRFKHFIPEKRLTWEYHERYFRESAQSFHALVPYRLLVNKSCRNTFSFTLRYLQTVAFYDLKLLQTFFKAAILKPGSAAAQSNKLAFISLKAKLLSFRNYSQMLQHFRELATFQKEMRKQNLNHLPVGPGKFQMAPSAT